MNWVEGASRKIEEALRKFEKMHGISEQNVVSEPYDLMCGKNQEKYPNSDLPGVYIFAIEEGILNVGKSKNQVGKQLHRDVKGWIEIRYFSLGKSVFLFTVNAPLSHPSLKEEYPLVLERFLQNELSPIEW